MKRYALLACIIVTAALGISAAARADTSGQELAERAGAGLIGMPAPRLVLQTIDGKTIDLGRLYGRQAVYLKFWATWCVPCREQMPHFERTYEQAGPDLAVVAINAGFNDSLEDVRTFQRKVGITMPIVIDDGRVAAAFNLRVTPQHIVIGRDGRVLYVGHLADAKLDAALASARTAAPSGAPGAAAAGPTPAASSHYAVGDLLPETAPLSMDGHPVHLRDARDPRPTILVFLSPWCESYLATTRPVVSANCRRMREQVEALAPSSRARWIGVASGLWATQEDLHEYQRRYGISVPLALDESGAMFHAFDVTQVPTALIVDRSGRLARRLAASDLQSETALRAALTTP